MDKNVNEILNKLINQYKHIIGDVSGKQLVSIEQAVSAITNYYETIINCMPGNVYWFDKSGQAIGCNQNVLDMFGLSSLKSFKGMNFEQMQTVGDWSIEATESFKNNTMRVMKTGLASLNIEEPPIPNSKGEIIHFLTSRVPIKDKYTCNVIGVVGISVNISELRNTQILLVNAKEKAEAANEAKSNFLAMMSHELRTPLNAILGMAQELEDDNLSIKQKKCIQAIISGGDHLLNLINEILDYSKFNSDEFRLKDEIFELPRLLEYNVKSLLPLAQKKSIKLELKNIGCLPKHVKGDQLRLSQVILNLVGNAIKFTEHGSIQINFNILSQDIDKIFIRFDIQDTGIGIPAKELNLIFEKFVQVESKYNRNHGGTGLGLAICKNLIEKMSGEISVTSEIGKGSCFTVILPFLLSITNLSNVADKNNKPKNCVPNLSGAYLLVVEDDLLNQKVISQMLNRTLCKFDICSTAIEALKLFKKNDYHLILTDIGLPHMDGFEFIERVRHLSTAKSIMPIIAVTAHASVSDKQRCINAGSNAVITKPVDKHILYENLQNWLNIDNDFGKPEVAYIPQTVEKKANINFKSWHQLPIFDVNAIKVTYSNQEKVILELVNLSLSSTFPEAEEAVNKACETKDVSLLLCEVHRLRGAVSYLHLIRLHGLTAELEHHLRADGWTEIVTQLISHLYNEILAAKISLIEYKTTLLNTLQL